MTLAIFDYDCLIYSYGFANETRQIRVRRKSNGKEWLQKNVTEWWGAGKKIGGLLAEINQKREDKGLAPFTKDHFEIVGTERDHTPLPYVLADLRDGIRRILNACGATEYMGYIGRGDLDRVERSTIVKYKGNRDDALKPLLYEDIVEYLHKHHNAEIIRNGDEADDWVVIEALKNKNSVIVAEDKDTLGNPVKVINPTKLEEGIIDCNQWGKIYRKTVIRGGEEKLGDVAGYGQHWFLFQLAFGDRVDNIIANIHSEVKMGEVAVYNRLKDMTNIQDGFKEVVNIYKEMYPHPKTVECWRGTQIEIDWLYVLSEVYDLVRMKKYEGDNRTVIDFAKHIGVDI